MRIKIVLSGVLAFALAFGHADAGLKEVEGKTVDSSSSDRQTRAVAGATTSVLASLSKDQRQSVQFAFTPQKLGTSAPLQKAADGGVAPGVPAGGQTAGTGGPGRGPGRGPGGLGRHGQEPEGGQRGARSGGAGMWPPGGFIGEQYGPAVWSNYPVNDVLRPGLRPGTLAAPQRTAAMHLRNGQAS